MEKRGGGRPLQSAPGMRTPRRDILTTHPEGANRGWRALFDPVIFMLFLKVIACHAIGKLPRLRHGYEERGRKNRGQRQKI